MNDTEPKVGLNMREKEAAIHVLWVTEREGYPPGSFVEKLLEAWVVADMGNQFRLGLGFPEYGKAIRIYKNEGATALKKWAGLLPTATTNEGTHE